MMKWFNNMKLSVKLLGGFILVAVIAGLIGIVGVRSLQSAHKEYSELYESYGVSLGVLGELSTAYQRTRVNLRELIIEKNVAQKGKYVELIRKYDTIINDNLAKYEKTATLEEDKKMVSRLKQDIARFDPLRERIIALAMSNQEEQATVLMRGEAYQLATDIADTIDKLVDFNTSTGEKESDKINKDMSAAIRVMIITMLLGVMVAVFLGIYIARAISRPISKMVNAAQQIAEGDLNVEIEVRSKDEIGILAAAFRKMADNVNDVMRNITLSAQQVAAAARQVSDSSQALSQGSTEQAASVEELSASMEEIAAQTSQNVVNANKVNEMSTVSKEAAQRGNSQMQEMLRAMEEINEASSSISKIIKVIDEIAFQTNILALNAAVEAARAGQHGKGFAVVAEEVRNLAARSADAAKETTAMIEGTIKKVEAGTKIANETAGALTQIVEGVTQSAALVAEIASASNEQASGISQVNQGIMQVSQVTQTNSATAEESASASEELSSQADMLRNMVAKFKLRQGGGSESLESLRPDIIKMLESMSGNRSQDSSPSEKAGNSKIQIHLDKNDFGKY